VIRLIFPPWTSAQITSPCPNSATCDSYFSVDSSGCARTHPRPIGCFPAPVLAWSARARRSSSVSRIRRTLARPLLRVLLGLAMQRCSHENSRSISTDLLFVAFFRGYTLEWICELKALDSPPPRQDRPVPRRRQPVTSPARLRAHRCRVVTWPRAESCTCPTRRPQAPCRALLAARLVKIARASARPPMDTPGHPRSARRPANWQSLIAPQR